MQRLFVATRRLRACDASADDTWRLITDDTWRLITDVDNAWRDDVWRNTLMFSTRVV